jgi:basic membrane lipoprotein Med (substrate-binding protein (PBP1-ABC) superfamily)
MNNTLPKNAQVYKQGYLDNNSDKYTMIYLVPFQYSDELKKLAAGYVANL